MRSLLRRFARGAAWRDGLLLLALLGVLLASAWWNRFLATPATLTADAPIFARGVHPAETGLAALARFRWTDGAAQLRLPTLDRAAMLAMTLAGGPGRRVPVQLRWGAWHAVFDVDAAPRVYRVLLPPQPGMPRVLAITSPTVTEQQQGQPPRALGVVVGSLRLAHVAPPLALLLVVALACAVGYVVLRAVGVHALLAASAVCGLQALWFGWHSDGTWRVASAAVLPLAGAATLAGAWLTGRVARDAVLPRAGSPGRMLLRGHARDWLAVGALLAATVLYFRAYLFSDSTIIPYDMLAALPPWNYPNNAEPHNFIMGDVIRAHVPWRMLYSAALRSGEIPFWNPYSFGGMPFLAYNQTGVLYPFNLLFVVLPLEPAFVGFLMLHQFLSGLGMYLLLRRFMVAPAALTGALAWMCCGFLTAWLLWLSTSATAAWLPWCLLAADWAITSGRRRAVGALALVVGLNVLAGHPQYAFYNFLMLGVYALWRVLVLPVHWRERVRRLALLGGGGMLGLLLVAAQVLPTLELLSYNTRSALSVADMIEAAPPLAQMITLVLPYWFGDVQTYAGAGNIVEFTGYIGVTSLVLAALALLRPGLHRRHAVWFFALLSVLVLSLVYGSALHVLLSYLPGYTSFRGVQRWYGVWSLAAAALVGWGVEALLLARGWRRRVLGGGLAGLLMASGLVLLTGDLGVPFVPQPWQSPLFTREHIAELLPTAGWWAGGLALAGLALLLARRDTRVAAGLACVPALLIGAELLHFSGSYLPVSPPSGYPLTPGLQFLRDHRAAGRIARFDESAVDLPLLTNTAIVFGLEDVHGYGSFSLDRFNRVIGLIEPERYRQVAVDNAFGGFTNPESLRSPLFDMLGVAFMLSTEPPVGAQPGWSLAYSGPDMTIYRNDEVLPRGFVVGRAVVQPTAGQQRAALANPAFSPGEEAVLPEAPSTPLDPRAAGEVQVLRQTVNTLELAATVQAAPGRAGLLVLQQNAYPGWTARVDGQAAPLLLVNTSMQGLLLPAGTHQITLRFVPSFFGVYAAVSLLALAVALWLIVAPAGRPVALRRT